MNAKKLLALSLACTLTLGLSACGGGQDAPSSGSPSGASDGDALKVGIILSTGGLGDKNFNDMTYAGAQQAEKDFGIEFDYVETQSASDFLPNYRMFAESGEYDLIIGLAADQTEAINEISIDFPEQKISHIDSSTDLPNVSAVYTKWQEQTFLTGVVAGLGTLSGMDKANSENVVAPSRTASSKSPLIHEMRTTPWRWFRRPSARRTPPSGGFGTPNAFTPGFTEY